MELLLDSASEEAFRADWVRLSELDLPSQLRNTSPSNRPHITLAAAPVIGAGFDPLLRSAVAGLPLEVRFGGLLLFGGGRRKFILVRSVVVSGALAELHLAVAGALAGLTDQAPTTFPGAWSPHVTLARGLSPDQVGPAAAAVTAVHGAEYPPASAATARRWDSRAKLTVDLSR